MGYFKELDIQLQEDFLDEEDLALDFDARDGDAEEWWRAQDDEMQMLEEEEQQIERLAEIQEYRTQGYM